MDERLTFRFVIVGSYFSLIQDLWDRIEESGDHRFAHIVHPSHDRASSPAWARERPSIHFMRENSRAPLPKPDRRLLASLEGGNVPTIHNMIMSDRFVSKLPYENALAYATQLTRRMIELYEAVEPSVLVGGFDGLHGSLAFAVARKLGVPWFALYFGSMPSGRPAFCADLSPASLVTVDAIGREELQARAESMLAAFEQRSESAVYYVAPHILSSRAVLKQIPSQVHSLREVARQRARRNFLQYTDPANAWSYRELVQEALRLRRNAWDLRGAKLRETPPDRPYALFGLHMQPESSIDVFAHFFANQSRVIELMARSLPPTHTLLVKLHKSDMLNYSKAKLAEYRRFPGVELVSPEADTRRLIENADLVFSIQGTMGLEAAMLGKPVIMFGDSATKIFPSVSTFGRTIDLPTLVRAKLASAKPDRRAVVDALATYLSPFVEASANDWWVRKSDEEIARWRRMMALLRDYVWRSEEPRLATGPS
jgi:hypothetical protein